MKIYVKTLLERMITLDVESGDTVEHLIDLVSVADGIPFDNIRLIFQGRQLEHGRTLSDYNIQIDSVLYMTLRLRGC